MTRKYFVLFFFVRQLQECGDEKETLKEPAGKGKKIETKSQKIAKNMLVFQIVKR